MSSLKFSVTPTSQRHTRPKDSELIFGRTFTDHMAIVDYDVDRGGWFDARVVPYGPLTLDPAAAVLHYGQELFDGLKAFRGADGKVRLFRLERHAKRMHDGGARLCMPAVPEDLFIEAVRGLVGADRIGAPALLDSHRPDAVGLGAYAHRRTATHAGDASPSPRRGTVDLSPSPLRGEGRVRGESPTLTLRRLRPPAPAAVTLTSGRPVALRSSRLTGRIVAGVGPWRSSGEWWSQQPWLQDEWDVELADGTLCRLANDGSAWHLAGIYD